MSRPAPADARAGVVHCVLVQDSGEDMPHAGGGVLPHRPGQRAEQGAVSAG